MHRWRRWLALQHRASRRGMTPDHGLLGLQALSCQVQGSGQRVASFADQPDALEVLHQSVGRIVRDGQGVPQVAYPCWPVFCQVRQNLANAIRPDGQGNWSSLPRLGTILNVGGSGLGQGVVNPSPRLTRLSYEPLVVERYK